MRSDGQCRHVIVHSVENIISRHAWAHQQLRWPPPKSEGAQNPQCSRSCDTNKTPRSPLRQVQTSTARHLLFSKKNVSRCRLANPVRPDDRRHLQEFKRKFKDGSGKSPNIIMPPVELMTYTCTQIVVYDSPCHIRIHRYAHYICKPMYV